MQLARRILLFISIAIALGFSISRLHKNFSEGQYISGHGTITVDSCESVGEIACKGTFMQNGGMITLKNATVETSEVHKKGDVIWNVWADYTGPVNKPTGASYETGAQRRSVLHNAVYYLIILSSLIELFRLFFPKEPSDKPHHRKKKKD